MFCHANRDHIITCMNRRHHSDKVMTTEELPLDEGMEACGCWDHATSNLDYESAPKWFFHCCDECEKTCVSCKKMDDDDDLLARFND